MAGYFRIYFLAQGKEHMVETWLNSDEPTSCDQEVLDALMGATPPGIAPSILRIIDLGTDGQPMLYDEFKVIDSKGITYGLVFQKPSYSGWFYLADLTDFERRPGKEIINDSFIIPGAVGYVLSNRSDLPAKATINWERLSVECLGEEFYLVPWKPLPYFL